MLPINNQSPFPAELLSILDKAGSEVRVLIVVATFQWDGSVGVSLAPLQEPICFGDEHRGDPATSSVIRESDLCMPKASVDVLVLDACAYAPVDRPATEVVVGLSVADIDKRLRVIGDRSARFPSGVLESSPRAMPFQKMQIIYERAFGGGLANSAKHPHKMHCWNPIGLGYQGAPPIDPAIATNYPNVEHLASTPQVARQAPAGFGIVGRGWAPRLQFAGTYNDDWLERQWPLLPADFDDQHYQCAPRDQQSRSIRGGERVTLTNMTADRLWEFKLPVLNVPVYLISDEGPRRLNMRLDTVRIAPERRQVVMCQRAVVDSAPSRSEPWEVAIGHMTDAWLRSRYTRRRYVDLGGSRGEFRGATYFS